MIVVLWDSYFAASLAASAATTMSPVVTWVSPPYRTVRRTDGPGQPGQDGTLQEKILRLPVDVILHTFVRLPHVFGTVFLFRI